ncbi:N-acetylmannosamine-6-phosphate 2-epimerase [Oscillospiraceae bacterium PP1C4]
MLQIKGKLIVSCQALPDEPLHSSFIMGKMALAAMQGGAGGIRANTSQDIIEIKKNVDLPIIGIIKKDYPDSLVYITPTIDEVDELVETGVDLIATDATGSLRPGGVDLEEFFRMVKDKHPRQKFMADCSTIDEVMLADRLGFDFIGTTLVGHTPQSKDISVEYNDFEIIKEILRKVSHPVIAEGNINTPQKLRRVLDLGCYSVVVGSSITRPQLITRSFVDAIEVGGNGKP